MEKKRYSEAELEEFEVIIKNKLDETLTELINIKNAISKKNDQGTENTSNNSKLMEDSAENIERENLSQLAARLQKFSQQLEHALSRIKNGTYGICIETGKLIPKDRLRAVPHTHHTIEAKLQKR